MDERRCLLFITGLMGSLLMAAPAQAEDIFEKPISVLEQWIETENVISREKTDWEVEKVSITDLIRVHRQELESLETQIAESETKTTEADKQRASLLEEDDALKTVSKSVAERLVGFENQIREMVARFPEPLRQQIDQLYSRLPADSEDTNLEVTVRMQNIVGILTQIDKFNNAVEINDVSRSFDDVEERVFVDVVYLGLAVGYYADEGGKHAGITYPTDEGWVWEARNELAPDILDLIDIYKKSAADARFIPLPVKIR